MGTTTGRLTSGFLILAVVWIAVYWLWEPRRSPAPISFATPPAAAPGHGAGGSGDAPGPSGSPKPVTPVTSVTSVPAPPAPAVSPKPSEGGTPSVSGAQADGTRSTPSQAPEAGVIPPEFRYHTLAKDDTFPSLAKKYFGSEKFANAIARANPVMDPRRLRPGRVVKIPVDPTNIQGKPAPGAATGGEEAAPRVTEYVVQSGDTLSGIAQELLGDSSRADEIYRLNRDVMTSPDELRLGITLKIPQEPGRER